MQDNQSEFEKHQSHQNQLIGFYPPPESVKVVTTLPNPGEKPTIQEVPLNTFEKKHGFTWIEGIQGPDLFIEKFVNPKKIAQRLATPKLAPEIEMVNGIKKTPGYRKDSAVYHTKEMGNGLMYVGEKPIPKDTIVFFYAGAFAQAREKGDTPYASSGIKSKLFAPTDTDGPTSTIDAEKFGNLTRFLNGMPQNLDDFEFASGVNRENIANANLDAHLWTIDELPLKIMITNREIQPGDIFGCDYGPNYWGTHELKKEGGQLLTQKDGTIIPPYLYRLKTIPVHFKYQKNQWKFSLISTDQCREIIDKPQTPFAISGPNGKLAGIFKIEEAVKALVRNNYAYGGKLDTIEQIDKSQPQQNIQGLNILQEHVDKKFCCFKRKIKNGLDLQIVDAIIEFKNEKEKNELLNKFSHSGLFPLMIGNHIIIEGINQDHIKDRLVRLEKLRCATKNNQSGVKALTENDFPSAIEKFNQSILVWTYLSEENPLLKSKVAIGHHNLARAYQKNGNISHAVVHFHLSEKFYRQCGDIKQADLEKTEKYNLLQESVKFQNSSSVLTNTAQTGISHFSLPKTENLLLKLETLVELFKTDPEQYKTKCANLPKDEQQMMSLFLQMEGLGQLQYDDINLEKTNSSTYVKKS